ncbi:MAG TPA: hypothetical protein PLV55_05690 [Anaerohalosphaeraceae bacterium]|nr:hypothetical protein [Anaerohalosphaeraceae bacterium]
MNEQEREQIDSLIHGFLDGELNERQRTELKRLAQHNPVIRKELHALFRQKELLGALPIEKAPDGLKDEVLARLERRLILSSETAVPSSRIGRLHLVLRWTAAAAAMVLLPLAILGLLALQIVQPPEPAVGPAAVPVQEQTAEFLPDKTPSAPKEDTVLVLGNLKFLTDQPIAVNDSIKKAVVSHKLLPSASSERFEDHAVYRIQCPQGQMLSFMKTLESVWGLCSKQQFVLAGGDSSASRSVVVEGIRPDQMEELIRQTSPSRLLTAASHLERVNRRGLSDAAIRVPAEETGGGEKTLLPVEPRLAWEKEQTAEESSVSGGPVVVLVIEVRNLTEKK